MRVTFVGKALIAFGLIGLVGCQGAAPSAEQAARREKIEQANLRNAQTRRLPVKCRVRARSLRQLSPSGTHGSRKE